jgi:hypothetical protein
MSDKNVARTHCGMATKRNLDEGKDNVRFKSLKQVSE